MPIYDLPSMNTSSGLDGLLIETAGASTLFIPMFLFFVYSLVFITTFRKQRESGAGDAPLCSTIAGVITTIIALMLSARTELMNMFILTIVIVVTIFSGIWLFSSRDR